MVAFLRCKMRTTRLSAINSVSDNSVHHPTNTFTVKRIDSDFFGEE